MFFGLEEFLIFNIRCTAGLFLHRPRTCNVENPNFFALKNKKMGSLITKIWQILKYFTRDFHQA